IQIVDRKDLARAFTEGSFRLQGLTDSRQALRLGKLLNADRLLTGGITRTRKGLRVQAHVFDVQTTQLIFSEEAAGSRQELNPIAERLSGAIASRISRAPPAPPAAADSHPEASNHFIRGIGFYYGNLYDHAAAEF